MYKTNQITQTIKQTKKLKEKAKTKIKIRQNQKQKQNKKETNWCQQIERFVKPTLFFHLTVFLIQNVFLDIIYIFI